MQTSIQGSMGSARDAVMVSALPPWVDRRTCVISEPPGSVRASFYCCCSVQKVKRTVKVGSSPNESATKLADSVKRGHDACQPVGAESGTTEVPSAADQAVRTKQLEGTILAQKRNIRCVQSALDQANVKVSKADSAMKEQAEHKRQETLAENRRVDVDDANEEAFTVDTKRTAMTAERTGMVDVIKYWAKGSAQKVFELVMAIITVFSLKQRVADELGVEADKTNADIVESLHDSVQILKCCNSEEQRQQYRVVLTASAPKSAARCDNTGMGNKFADRLEINRKSVPYLECIAKRAEIEVAAKIQKREIALGDHVDCRHGTGTLVE
jgi:hypothetical protein